MNDIIRNSLLMTSYLLDCIYRFLYTLKAEAEKHNVPLKDLMQYAFIIKNGNKKQKADADNSPSIMHMMQKSLTSRRYFYLMKLLTSVVNAGYTNSIRSNSYRVKYVELVQRIKG